MGRLKPAMANEQRDRDRQLILDAQQSGRLSEFSTYVKLSGPGWMQSALTLGGGSLGSSLYLGILAGVSMIWLQPFAMILGVIMLSAISYVTLSTGQRPFRAINEHINPVLGWSWLLASLMANMVWAMPQYSLCFGVMEQNLVPSLFSGDGFFSDGQEASVAGKWTVSVAILVLCTLVSWSYGSGSKGVKIYEGILKVVVALIVLCFVGVVLRMATTGDGIAWSALLSGLIPKLHHLYAPAETFQPLLDALGDGGAVAYWSDYIVNEQRDVMLSAGAAAVGINMTFLLPYNLLSRGWNRDFRGLSIFDLCTGTFIPFILATGCVVIASATQFHAKLPEGFQVTETEIIVPEALQERYDELLAKRQDESSRSTYDLPESPQLAEKKLAAVLVKRDTGHLASSLEKLFSDESGGSGRFFSDIVFGIGVMGMTLSSISLMMVISGLIVCEVLNVPTKGWAFRLGCLISATGVLWPLVWQGDAKAWLTVRAGVIGSMLLPIAYLTFLWMMNKKSLMGDSMPQGFSRVVWNTLMSMAALAATAAGVSAIYKKAEMTGLYVVAGYLALVLIVQVLRKPVATPAVENDQT